MEWIGRELLLLPALQSTNHLSPESLCCRDSCFILSLLFGRSTEGWKFLHWSWLLIAGLALSVANRSSNQSNKLSRHTVRKYFIHASLATFWQISFPFSHPVHVSIAVCYICFICQDLLSNLTDKVGRMVMNIRGLILDDPNHTVYLQSLQFWALPTLWLGNWVNAFNWVGRIRGVTPELFSGGLMDLLEWWSFHGYEWGERAGVSP